MAGIGELFKIPPFFYVTDTATVLLSMAFNGSYRKTERIGLAFGLAELAFIPAMVMAHPNLGAFGTGLCQMPLGTHSYLQFLAANVGAVIMPWMIVYQQGAT